MLKVLRQAGDIVAKKWNRVGRGWKITLAILLIILAILGIIALVFWMLGKLIKSLGSPRNKSLYIPSLGKRG
jgi:flagellar biogenesis protein FliO